MPLSVKKDTAGQAKVWAATLRASYVVMNNKEGVEMLNPDDILNASLNLSHTKPIGRRWHLIASAGVGIYSAPSEIAWHSILVNGAVIFAYRLTDDLSIGLGGGLTISYGVPMLLPMGYLNWKMQGRLNEMVDLASGLKVKASTMFTERVGLSLTLIEMDGMTKWG